MDPSLIEAGLALTWSLDTRYGLAKKQTLSQRDVPGMTRALVPLLSKAGVTAISIGANDGSTPPSVPKVFEWVDKMSNTSLLGLFNWPGYGGISNGPVVVNGVKHALVYNWNGYELAETVVVFLGLANWAHGNTGITQDHLQQNLMRVRLKPSENPSQTQKFTLLPSTISRRTSCRFLELVQFQSSLKKWVTLGAVAHHTAPRTANAQNELNHIVGFMDVRRTLKRLHVSV